MMIVLYYVFLHTSLVDILLIHMAVKHQQDVIEKKCQLSSIEGGKFCCIFGPKCVLLNLFRDDFVSK